MTTATMTTKPPTKDATYKLELRTAYGPVFRDVLNTSPRPCLNDEIPVIDLSPILSPNFSDRKALASEVRAAAVNTGFFYIKNHGIPAQTIQNAKQQCLRFFHQPLEEKLKLARKHFVHFNGYTPAGTTVVNKGERKDTRESFAWQYAAEYDPDRKVLGEIPDDVKAFLRGEELCWSGNGHLTGFREDSLAYWRACMILARRLVKIFAVALDLPEDYFDSRTTYPGADGVYNYYPPALSSCGTAAASEPVGLGSHTDLQLFTLLYQSPSPVSSLQVLTNTSPGQWILAPPMEGTLVVNIGDFLMRLSNDIFKSTVHRVSTSAEAGERVSMPFFFGLNFNCVEGVLPTCVSEDRPAKYEPISCGEWVRLRFVQEAAERGEVKAEAPGAGRAIAPTIVAAA